MVEFQGKFDSTLTNNLNKRQFKRIWWFFVLFPILLVGMGVMMILMPEDQSDIYAGIAIICFGVLFPPLLVLLTRFAQKKINKSMYILSNDTTSLFQFYPDRVVITMRKGEEYEGITTAKYSYFYRVEETPDTYFLSIAQGQFHVVNKTDLTHGTLEELNSILSTNLGAKFKRTKF